ncbi:38124_t:CDS:2 [Gigaspora margarita]|uniref:38124_t:CDS:1 n=1 Tax=Gigaspora margarita TaxID=4874 RepID=A0ABM8VY18_GIGMA|nr:38124_t:CDS:2 [Gigaspora margarita]
MQLFSMKKKNLAIYTIQGKFYYPSEEVSTRYDQYYQFERYSQFQDSHLSRHGQRIESAPSHLPLCSCFHAHSRLKSILKLPFL